MNKTRKRKLISTALAAMLVLSMVLIPMASADNKAREEASGADPQASVYTETALDGMVGLPDDADRDGAAADDSASQDAGADLQQDPAEGDASLPDENPTDQGGDSPKSAEGAAPSDDADAREDGIGSATLSGTVWHDEDEDGIRGAGEQAIPDFALTLCDEAGNGLSTTRTDANGRYEFSAVDEGTYSIKAESQTVDGVEYVPPAPEAGVEEDNKFEEEIEGGEPVARTEPIDVEAGASIESLSAGMRAIEPAEAASEGGIAPLSDGVLTVDVREKPLSWANLQSTLKSLYSDEVIAAATVLKIIGSQDSFELGSTSSAPSIVHLNGLNIDTIDMSQFTGGLGAGAFNGAKNIKTIALGTSIETIGAVSSQGCSSLTTISDTLENAAANPGIIDLASAGVKEFVGNSQFLGCTSITAVTFGPDVETLSFWLFSGCKSLVAVGGSVADIRAYPNVIDLSSTNVTELVSNTFDGCTSVKHVALGKNISDVPKYAFNNCKALSSVSDTPANALANPTVLDLEKTGVKTLGAGGWQFKNGEGYTTVTLGKGITFLPGSVFAGAKSLRTLSDTLDSALATPNVVDLGATGVVDLESQGWQFGNCSNISTVVFGTKITSLPSYVFVGCISLSTISDTLINARGSSYGFVDFEKLPVVPLTSGGWQFNGVYGILYAGAEGLSFPSYSLGGMKAFVPETIGSVEFTADSKASKVYVRGPEVSSPTAVVGSEHQAVNYYLDSLVTKSGLGTVTAWTYNQYDPYIPDRINEREIGKGRLEEGHRYVEEGKELKFVVEPNPNAALKRITYNGEPVEPIAIENTYYYTLPALTEDTVINFEFSNPINVFHLYVDRSGNAIDGYPADVRKVDEGEAYSGTAPDISGYAYQGFELDPPTPHAPSSATDKAAPHIDRVTGATYLYLVYGRDAGGGEVPGVGGGGRVPDGIEDVDVERQWGTIAGGSFSAFPGISPDTQIVNIGSEFDLGATDAPVENLPAGYTYVGYLTDKDPAGTKPHSGSPAFSASMTDGNRMVHYIYEQSVYEVTEHHVDRSGKMVAPDTSQDIDHGNWYPGTGSQTVTGMVYAGAEYQAPTADNRSMVDDGSLPELFNVQADAEVWYVYGYDNGGGSLPGPGGGGDRPDGLEDFEFSRQWVTRASDGSLVPLPTAATDRQILNVGTTFELAYDDAPVPSIPAGYDYRGYLTDQDAPGAALHPGTPDIVSNIVDGNRQISYVFSAPLESPSVDAPLETVTTVTGSADRGNTVTVTFANGQTATGVASSLAPLSELASADVAVLRTVETGYWTVDVPAGVILARGDEVSATQTDSFGRVSPLASTNVLPVDHDVSIAYTDESGKTIPGGTSSTVAHRQPFSYEPPTVSGYTYSGWSLNGADQGTGNPSIPSVTASHAITLVYTAKGGTTPDPGPGPNPNPEEGNYNFVKAPNVKSVKPGETVTYTFTGFENKWGASLDRYAITDKPDKGLDFVSASLPSFSGAEGVTYDVVYYTNLKGRSVLHSNIDAGKPFSFNAPSLGAGDYITGLVIDFGTVPEGFGQGNQITMQFRVWDNPPSKTLNNVGMLSYWKDGESFEFSSGKSGSVVLGGYFSDLVRTGDGPLIAMALAVGGAVVAAVFVLISMIIRSRRKKRAMR